MASREQNRRGTRRDTVNQDDQLATRLLDDQERLDGMTDTGPFTRFAATPDRLAQMDRERAERFIAQADAKATGTPATAVTPVTTRVAAQTSAPAPMSELTRLTDRLVEARELLAAAHEQLQSQQTLTEIAVAEATNARVEARALQDRLTAARALVMEAQRTAQQATERCAFVEGRADSLERALELAVNASFWKRMTWRRSRARAL